MCRRGFLKVSPCLQELYSAACVCGCDWRVCRFVLFFSGERVVALTTCLRWSAGSRILLCFVFVRVLDQINLPYEMHATVGSTRRLSERFTASDFVSGCAALVLLRVYLTESVQVLECALVLEGRHGYRNYVPQRAAHRVVNCVTRKLKTPRRVRKPQ